MLNKKCEYCGSDTGQIEWHHPVPQYLSIGVFLCQKHHSLVQGRKKLYTIEFDKNLESEREKVTKLVYQRVERAIQVLTHYLVWDKFKG